MSSGAAKDAVPVDVGHPVREPAVARPTASDVAMQNGNGNGRPAAVDPGSAAPSARSSRPGRAARVLKNRAAILAVVSLVAGAVIWQLVALWAHNYLFFPPLTQIWSRFLELAGDGTLARNLAASFQEYGWGFLAALIVGSAIGVLMAASSTARDLLDPWVTLLNATPVIALAPLFIVIFGLGLSSKVAIVFLVMLFPILLNTYIGLSNTDDDLVEAVRSYGANGRQVYLKVKLPMALPSIVAGLRLALAHGLVGVVVSEFFGARDGIGMMIFTSAQTFDTNALYVGVIILGLTGVVLTYGLLAVERRVARWRFAKGESA
jgi:NitT/TauT family transport system permease protein